MPNKRQNPIASPSDGNRCVINNVRYDMPVMFSGIPGGSSIKAVMCRRQRQKDSSLSGLYAHIAMFLP
jgi:hypothetical protein